MKRIIALTLSALMLASCAKEMGATTYKSGNAVGKVLRGTIVNVQAITIRDNDSASQNGIGTLGGAAAGGAAASTIGQGDGKTVAMVGGAIAGAIVGALVEEELSTQAGYEYVVQLNAPAASSSATTRIDKTETRRYGGASMEDDIKKSIKTQESQSDMISVIQTDTQPLYVGQPVLIIYHDDRPRVVADQSRR